MKKVLLTTVCGPFGADTDDCTRHVMPELFHAQVTRAQGIFSLRSTYISYGLEYIAKNITTPATVLQYPTMKQFKRELNKGYDYVGISFVIATFGKLKKMCKMVKEVSPASKIILGGYGTMLPECD
ncbi:MAG: radical SAM protein, partial [Deltaproteobacteria bacterium]|nr:radical SAM protein [Deltaproteobacteria bacterium]